MIGATAAEAKILELTPSPQGITPERVALTLASGRVLAEAVTSSLDIPHWDNSAMDGYALRAEDVRIASPECPVSLMVTQVIPAGQAPIAAIGTGQAARLFTGSMLPPGADTVVMQEDTCRQGSQVDIRVAPPPGEFVRHRGSFYQAGTPLMAPGTRLGGPEIALLAAAQCPQVSVFPRLRVAILSTGNELVGIDTHLQPGQIVDSNQYALAALVQQAGAIPLPMGIIPDHPDALARAITAAQLQADMVLSSGGVSVGDLDYVDRTLSDLGATLHIKAVAVKPGKPLTVATLSPLRGNRPMLYFGLPGNPVSALVSFWRFVEPALRKQSGLRGNWSPRFLQAHTTQSLRSQGNRETYLWGRLEIFEASYQFHPVTGSYSSGNLVNLAGTNALAVLPPGTWEVGAGDPITVMMVGNGWGVAP